MTENFDRAPGAGRNRAKPNSPGLGEQAIGRILVPGAGGASGDAQPKQCFFQQEPLRQPRTSPPPVVENSANAVSDSRRAARTPPGAHEKHSAHNSNSAPRVNPQVADALLADSRLSATAPEFYPANYSSYTDTSFEDGSDSFSIQSEPTLSEFVQDFLSHLNDSPGAFETDIEHITAMLNGWVTTDEMLHELVELIYQQSTLVPNFSYTGARLCNYLSHHLTMSPPSGNFRKLLLLRCQTEFDKREQAVKEDEATRKRFHSFVLFLGELYLNLEIKGSNGQMNRAEILLTGLRDLMNALFSNPVDGNLICAVKLLKLTGSVLEDAWKEKGKSDMDELIQRIENIVLDASCSRDVKQMLLRLVELRSSNWGRVQAAAACSEATPENDPNYFMNEPTFYTADGVPFTAADPDYSEKYQEMLDREDLFPDFYEENGTHPYSGDAYLDDDDDDDEMDPEIEEAFEKFCLESEKKRKQ
ncbi:polyadenylate-binding protein-interacting protein 1-like [Acipenser ruthenus]|uniref:polyadenylate-binding protein-interacting protein 1-like n=1 Tax=Acipenser ruthenus TaxID=7906 RepID=UPI0027412082|nr:polyadenylate-binding protein-interacting protein 1-like [Acipenser ruthenus]